MAAVKSLICFKAYDVRGKLAAKLIKEIVYCIGRAHVKYLNAKRNIEAISKLKVFEKHLRAIEKPIDESKKT